MNFSEAFDREDGNLSSGVLRGTHDVARDANRESEAYLAKQM